MTQIALVALLLSGCGLVDKAKNTIKGLTNDLAANGLVLGVEAPGSASLKSAIPEDYQAGTSATVFLADAKQVADVENAPIEGAEVSVDAVLATDRTGGAYTIEPRGGLAYDAGQTWDVAVGIEGREDGIASVHLPPAADVDLPTTHNRQDPLTLDVAGQGFHWVLLVVVDTRSGSVTYSNDPQGVGELLDLIGTNEVDDVEIPGDAFPGASVYAVGIAGMHNTETEDLDNMNTAASTLSAGLMQWHAITTL